MGVGYGCGKRSCATGTGRVAIFFSVTLLQKMLKKKIDSRLLPLIGETGFRRTQLLVVTDLKKPISFLFIAGPSEPTSGPIISLNNKSRSLIVFLVLPFCFSSSH